MAEKSDVVEVKKETLTDFNLNEALTDSAVAITDAEGNIIYGNYFRYENGVYKCEVNGKTLTFDHTGRSLVSEGDYQLSMVSSDIVAGKDATGTRGDGTTVEIAELNAREKFAASVMRGLLSSVQKPLNLSDASIKQYVGMSFKIATEMMNKAAEYRSGEVKSEEVKSEE